MTDVLDVRGLSERASLSQRTIRSYLAHKETPLPHFKVGGKVLVRWDEFELWLEQFRAVEAGSAKTSRYVDEILEPKK